MTDSMDNYKENEDSIKRLAVLKMKDLTMNIK